MKILNDLQPTRDYLDVLLAIATQCLDDAEGWNHVPHWAITMEMLAKKAIEELDKLHEVLELEEKERKNASLHA